MADFVKRRLQVFVSSTYTDLIQERQAAVEAILVAHHMPAGMELFTAGDESQMAVIKQWIDESDVFLLILGGRYGSIEPTTGKSYTHLEYEYALAKGKPLFACVVKDDSVLERKGRDEGETLKFFERENPQKLKELRDLVTSKMVRFWEDSKDIRIAVSETLASFSQRSDLVGWQRATEPADNVNDRLDSILDRLDRLAMEAPTPAPVEIDLTAHFDRLEKALQAIPQTSQGSKASPNNRLAPGILELLRAMVDNVEQNLLPLLQVLARYMKDLNVDDRKTTNYLVRTLKHLDQLRDLLQSLEKIDLRELGLNDTEG